MIPIERQCALLGISRSAYYYQPVEIDPMDLTLMKKIDEQYTPDPLLRCLENDRLVEKRRPSGQSQAGAAADASDGA